MNGFDKATIAQQLLDEPSLTSLRLQAEQPVAPRAAGPEFTTADEARVIAELDLPEIDDPAHAILVAKHVAAQNDLHGLPADAESARSRMLAGYALASAESAHAALETDREERLVEHANAALYEDDETLHERGMELLRQAPHRAAEFVARLADVDPDAADEFLADAQQRLALEQLRIDVERQRAADVGAAADAARVEGERLEAVRDFAATTSTAKLQRAMPYMAALAELHPEVYEQLPARESVELLYRTGLEGARASEEQALKQGLLSATTTNIGDGLTVGGMPVGEYVPPVEARVRATNVNAETPGQRVESIRAGITADSVGEGYAAFARATQQPTRNHARHTTEMVPPSSIRRRA